ncbi:MAG TPA: hypothetical protein VIA82_10575 [Candidatus Limnocylindria bacterium]
MSLLAYIDPGSGSLLLQAILAAVISVPFFFRRTIGGAIGRLRGRPRAGTPAPPAADSQPDTVSLPHDSEPPQR